MNLKITIGSFVIALLVPATAHAATLVYQGSNYANLNNIPIENCLSACLDEELAEFDTSMSLTVTVETDGPLQASSIYATNPIPLFEIGITFVSGSDGVIAWPYGFRNMTPTSPYISFGTDANANITFWSIEYFSGIPTDYYRTYGSSSGGDSSGWRIEYVQSCEPGTPGCTNGNRESGGGNSASTGEIGTWTVLPSVPPAPVPLPATGWLGVIASLAWLFTGSRKSRRLAQG